MKRSRCSQVSRGGEHEPNIQTLICNLIRTMGEVLKKTDDSFCLGKKGFWRKLQRKGDIGARP